MSIALATRIPTRKVVQKGKYCTPSAPWERWENILDADLFSFPSRQKSKRNHAIPLNHLPT